MKKFLLPVLLITLGVAGVIGWPYLNKPTSVPIGKTQTPISKPTGITNNIPTPTEGVTNEAPLQYVNPSVVIDAIKTAIPGKIYTELLPVMLPNVTLIKYATSCCGLITKTNAISELSYLNNASGPWNFADANPIATKIEAGDPEHFSGMMIGTSADYHAVGFLWNDDFLIEKISIVNDYRLIIGN